MKPKCIKYYFWLSYTNVYSVHPLDIQYPPISLREVHRVAVSTIFKVFGITRPRVD